VRVSLWDTHRIRRIYRRLGKMRGRGHLHRLTVFIRHKNVIRLLEFLGTARMSSREAICESLEEEMCTPAGEKCSPQRGLMTLGVPKTVVFEKKCSKNDRF